MIDNSFYWLRTNFSIGWTTIWNFSILSFQKIKIIFGHFVRNKHHAELNSRVQLLTQPMFHSSLDSKLSLKSQGIQIPASIITRSRMCDRFLFKQQKMIEIRLTHWFENLFIMILNTFENAIVTNKNQFNLKCNQ